MNVSFVLYFRAILQVIHQLPFPILKKSITNTESRQIIRKLYIIYFGTSKTILNTLAYRPQFHLNIFFILSSNSFI